jgi:hypothetical protein
MVHPSYIFRNLHTTPYYLQAPMLVNYTTTSRARGGSYWRDEANKIHKVSRNHKCANIECKDIDIHRFCFIKNIIIQMKDWTMNVLMKQTKFITNTCSDCKSTPTRILKIKYPMPHIEIYKTTLSVLFPQYKTQWIVYFTSYRSHMREKEGYNVVHLHWKDPIPMVKHKPRMKGRPCTKCRIGADRTLIVTTSKCPKCNVMHEQHVLDRHSEIPKKSHPFCRMYRIDNVVHAVIPLGCYNKTSTKSKRADFTWITPKKPDINPTLIRGTKSTTMCEDCIGPVPAKIEIFNPIEEPKDEFELELELELYNEYLVCWMCEHVNIPDRFTVFQRLPSSRHFPSHPEYRRNGYAFCKYCTTTCSDCGIPALTEPDPLCNGCSDKRRQTDPTCSIRCRNTETTLLFD